MSRRTVGHADNDEGNPTVVVDVEERIVVCAAHVGVMALKERDIR